MKPLRLRPILPIAALCAVFAAVLMLSACGPEAMVEVYGKQFSAEAESIAFEGGEVDGFAELLGKLGEFKNLRSVDFGSYSVEAADAASVRGKFSGVGVTIRTHVTICGKEFDTCETEIDLTGAGFDSVEELEKRLPYLTSLSKLVCHDSTIPYEEKLALAEKHPNIQFDVISVVNIHGTDYDEGTTALDLKQCTPDGDLAEKLRLLPALETVDLRGTGIGPELQKKLADACPDVRFLWEAELFGSTYDSETEEIDLSKNRGLSLDEIRQALPLFCGLKRLDLSDCGFSNEDLGALREEFPDVKIVWRLYMGKWSLKTDAVAFSVLITDYDYTALTSEDIEVLKYCTDLRALDLGHQRITDLSVIGDYLTELRILILADNWVSDLTPLTKLKHLHYIELFVNPYLEDVSPLGECKEMVDINISHLYKIEDVSNLLDFPIVERFWIENTGVSDADVQMVVDAYPNANVNYDGWGSVDKGWRTHPRYYAMIDMFYKTDYLSEEFSKYDSAD